MPLQIRSEVRGRSTVLPGRYDDGDAAEAAVAALIGNRRAQYQTYDDSWSFIDDDGAVVTLTIEPQA